MKTPTTYQREIATAVTSDVLQQQGSVFTVEMPLGAGVNELASQLEMLVMSVNLNAGGALLRVVPDGQPDVKQRLVSHLRAGSLKGLWSDESACVRLGRAQVLYAAPDDLEHVRGQFELIQVVDAHLLRPAEVARLQEMAGASGATVVLYGRPWNGETPFEHVKLANKEAAAAGGDWRHFRVPLERAEAELQGYATRVEAERGWLGDMHPEFETAYALRPVSGGASAFPRERLRDLFGTGGPRRLAVADRLVASIVVTRAVGMVDSPATAVASVASRTAGGLRVLDHKWAEAADEATLVAGLKRFVEKTWPCESVLVRVRTSRDDGRMRDLLQRSLQQGHVQWFTETSRQRERESSAVIAAALTGRVGFYAPDGSPEYRALRREMEWAVLRVGEGRGFTVAVEGQDEGFLEGIAMLASEDAEQAGEQQMAFPMAIAS
ncbi:MAG: hypothetical protein F4185_03240 [Chloroflexi bacterium]|nr:hypothetical protein [Chloroflexota bacterium]MYF64965.1 hypothetical protein [Chloroflexota bacterium]MYK34494.1 hypothetical protein [Chloroflexota bacterium]